MNKQISKQDQAIFDMDFSKMENHYLTGPVEYDSFIGPAFTRHYSSPAMDVLGFSLMVDILGISRVSYGTWRITFNCYIYDGRGSLQERFTLHSRVHSESYIDAWTPEDPDGYRGREAYNMLFSQLDEEKLYENCMVHVEEIGQYEQQRIVDVFNL